MSSIVKNPVLTRIPTDLLVIISSFLSYRYIIKLSLASKNTYRLLQVHKFWEIRGAKLLQVPLEQFEKYYSTFADFKIVLPLHDHNINPTEKQAKRTVEQFYCDLEKNTRRWKITLVNNRVKKTKNSISPEDIKIYEDFFLSVKSLMERPFLQRLRKKGYCTVPKTRRISWDYYKKVDSYIHGLPEGKRFFPAVKNFMVSGEKKKILLKTFLDFLFTSYQDYYEKLSEEDKQLVVTPKEYQSIFDHTREFDLLLSGASFYYVSNKSGNLCVTNCIHSIHSNCLFLPESALKIFKMAKIRYLDDLEIIYPLLNGIGYGGSNYFLDYKSNTKDISGRKLFIKLGSYCLFGYEEDKEDSHSQSESE
jgi:hypothetical protein